MTLHSVIKSAKRALKTHPATRRPVWYLLNSRDRMKWRLLSHRRARRYPTVINIETTNYCNEKCWFCPRAEATRGFGFVSLDLVKKIVAQGVPHGGVTYYLHKDGEPLMHPRILDIVATIKSAHPANRVRLTTNGTLLTEDKARRLLELGIDQLRVGIRAATRETYKRVHKKDHFDRVKANIERFLELKQEMKVRRPLVMVQIVVCEDTVGEIDLFRQQWGDKDVAMEIKDFMSWGGWTADGTLPPENNDPRRPPCIDPFHNLVVNWDGKVSLCSLDWNNQVQFGDVSRQNVADVWHGEPAEAVRQAHLRGDFKQNSMCANCQEWRYVPNLFWRNRLLPWKETRWL
jgi:radical SAM protein with 4Fe4S-binding SPASM domain